MPLLFAKPSIGSLNTADFEFKRSRQTQMMDTSLSLAMHAAPRTVMDHVDPDRLLGMQRQLACFGALESGGIAREALSDVDIEARKWLSSLVSGEQYSWLIDDAANLFLRREGSDPNLAPVMTGSHIDTQPVGGWLDGAYGIIAGIETMRALDDAGIQTRRPLEVAVWTNEEGSRFNPGAMGSSAFVDPSLLAGYLQVRDREGTSFEHARDKALRAATHAKRVSLRRPVHTYLEAHIEQGPVLESDGCTLGIVTGIQGVRWFEITVHGRSAHAGTTPSTNRQDALMTSASLVTAIGELAQQRRDSALRVTVGRFEVSPGSINTIADQVIFTIDLRHPDEAVLEELDVAFRTIVSAGSGKCRCEVRRLMLRAPTVFDSTVLAVLDAAVRASNVSFRRIESGAFHDAMYLADLCPAAMLFVPSREGISHNPAEDTADSDLVAGARALAGALTSLATDLPFPDPAKESKE